jgi:hypothetical protein
MRPNGALRGAISVDREGRKAKNEENGTATKKTQKSLQIKTVEENRRRK